MATQNEVTLAISAENTYSNAVLVNNTFNFSLISTSFVGTLTLQRRFNDSDTWRDVSTYTTDFEGWDHQPGVAQLRFGVKTGEYTSGTITGRLANAKN